MVGKIFIKRDKLYNTTCVHILDFMDMRRAADEAGLELAW